MNSDVMPSIVQMDPAVLKNLLTEVKETVATNLPVEEEKKASFAAVNMWNIRRNAKTMRSMLTK